jgi:hypothetical protein
MRKRLGSLLHRWAYRIEGRQPAHRASYVYASWDAKDLPTPMAITFGTGGHGGGATEWIRGRYGA